MSFLLTRLEPTPMQAAPALKKASALARSTPPTAMMRACFSGPSTSLMYPGPSAPAGNTLTMSAPASMAVRISVGVITPGTAALP